MAKYVEFVGAPGVGKSTTFEFLRGKHKAQENWILYDDLFQNNRTGIKERIRQFFRLIIRPNTFQRSSYNWYILNRFFQENPELVKMFWENFSQNEDINGKDLRFQVVQYVLKISEKLQSIKEEKVSKWCIVDEGLIHNLNYFIGREVNCSYNKNISRVLDLIELPGAVVYFNGDIDTIVKRTEARSKKNPRDERLSSQQLFEARARSLREKQIYIEAIQRKNIPVLHLESNDNVSEKAEKIMLFINGLDLNLREKHTAVNNGSGS